MGFDTKTILNKTREGFMKAGKNIKQNYETKKKDYTMKRDSIKELDYNQLKRLYESRTGKKAEILKKDFNTGKVINKRAMTRGELELRLQFSKNVSTKQIKSISTPKMMKKKKNKSKGKNITLNLKI